MKTSMSDKVYSGQVRQGDVLIVPATKAELAGLKPTAPTAALGERTGHHHTFEGPHAKGFYKEGEDHPMAGGQALARFVVITGTPAAITHQEHGPIVQAPGVRRNKRQLQYQRERIQSATD